MTTRSPNSSPAAARHILLSERGLDKDSTICVIQRHVSRSGMTRYLSLFLQTNGEIRDITDHAAALIGAQVHRERHALIVGGVGMDMHFHTVYRLSLILFGDGYALTHRTL